MIWKVLGIEKTKDEDIIKAAYREKLRLVNPEDDAEGFKELRRAYEEAVEYAMQDEEMNNEMDSAAFAGRKNDVDLWIDRVDEVYRDVKTRIDTGKWETLLRDPICDDLDTEMEAGEKLLVYFMSHSYMPKEIWCMVDKRFGYMENYEQLKERFPENYLEYVKWQIKSQSFIDFELFDGKTDANVDEYINKLYEIKGVSEEKDLKKMRQLLKELSRFDVEHPYAKVEEARYLIIKAQQLEEEAENGFTKERENERAKYLEDALSIMEELDFEYSDNPYIERIYAEILIENKEISKAEKIYDALLEANSENYNAMLGKANCTFLNGNPEDAKEQIEEVLEDRVQDADCLALLEKVNEILVKDYEERIKDKLDLDICCKLGWCYYQQKEFKKGIELLDRLGESEEYDYINLRCRLYLAGEEYEKAYPLTRKWLQLIEESEDDGSKEMQKRKNRLSLAHFSIGVCAWEDQYKKAVTEEQKQASFKDTIFYIKKAIQEEQNTLVKLSYMEQLARFYLDADSYNECIEMCNEILQRDRGFFPAYVHRQKANYELKNAKEVIDDYFSCIEIYPAYAPPYILAAEVFFAFDQYDDVEQVINAAKEAGLESDSLELYRIRCIHYKEFSKENVQKALEAMEELRRGVQKRLQNEECDIEDIAELDKEYAILYWDLDETEKTLDVIDGFLKKEPDSTVMLHLKVDVLNRENRCDEALKVCEQLFKLEPDNLFTKNKLAGCYERTEQIDRAISCYKEVLEKNEEYVPAIRRLMYIYSYLSNHENDLDKCRIGIDYATRLIDLTGSAEGYIERGNLYIDVYELEKAVEDCKKAIELDPEAYYAYNNLGCALLKLRRVNEAIEPLKQAIIMDRNRDHLPYLNLAECYVLQQSYGKAIDAYKEVLRLRPKATHIKKDIADIYVLQKDYAKAIAYYEEQIAETFQAIKNKGLKDKIKFYIGNSYIEEKERLFDLYCDLADVYQQAGNVEKEREYYGKVFSDYKKNLNNLTASIMESGAVYYRDKGELEKAVAIAETALQNLRDEERNTKDHENLLFAYATICFEMGRQKDATHYAEVYMNKLLKRYGGEKNFFKDRRYLPSRLYDLGIMNICAGNLEQGRKYLEQITDCHLCVICEKSDCFEYYFGMGLLAELEGRTQDAIELYQKAVSIKPDYFCAKRHLDKLKDK